MVNWAACVTKIENESTLQVFHGLRCGFSIKRCQDFDVVIINYKKKNGYRGKY